MIRSRSLPTALVLLTLLATPALRAQDATAPENPWEGSLGLSALITSGNSDTQSLGADVAFKRKPMPWGLEVTAQFARVEDQGVKTAERYLARLRGERMLDERWSLFAGAGFEQDKFAGFDRRTVIEAGGKYGALLGPVHELSFDAGLTWTREEFVSGLDDDYLGALFGLAYAWKISDTAKLTERLVTYPNLDDSNDWRLTSETALQADLNSRLALKLGYLLRYDHQPPPGFEDTDTTTTVSLVVKL